MTDHRNQEFRTWELENQGFPYVVCDDDGVIDRFATIDDAAQYIRKLSPGQYYIDGPEMASR